MTPHQRRRARKEAKVSQLLLGHQKLTSLDMPEASRNELLVWFVLASFALEGQETLGRILHEHPEMEPFIQVAVNMIEDDLKTDPDSYFHVVAPELTGDDTPAEENADAEQK